MQLKIAGGSRIATKATAGPQSECCNTLCRKLRYSGTVITWVLFFALGAIALPSEAATNSAHSQSASSIWQLAQSDPAAIMRKVSQNELSHSYGHRPPMRYRIRKVTKNSDKTKEIVETTQGGVARLIAINNKPLTAAQQKTEMERLRKLSTDSSRQEHRLRSEQKDADRIQQIMRLLPDAFTYKLAEPVTPSAATIHLTFTPNPHFSPPTLESRILTGVRGDIWIDPQDLRVVRIQSHIFKEIEYGWGILATLYPGGTILIEQVKTPECGWQLAHLNLELTGKKFMFQSLRISINETATHYFPVQQNWSYVEAIEWLLQMPAPSVEQSKLFEPPVK